jgi:hypothetical protein
MRIVIWAIVAAVFILFSINESGLSQEITQITDVELRAAYCLGVATQQSENSHKKSQSEENKLASKLSPDDFWMLDIFRNLERDTQQIIIERRDRFRDYLKAKGFMTGRNIKTIEVALRRGTTDATQCAIDVDDKIQFSITCTRVKRCLENFLPF